MQRSRVALALSLIILGLAVGGCSGAATSSVLPVSPVPSGAPSTRIVVQLTDALRIDPGVISVPAGVPVTFVVTNAGAIEHEFFIGDEAAQSKHESEMQMAGMHEDPNGITLKAGETKELTHVFVGGGSNIAGCHVVGHYGGGMKATITVAG